MNLKIASRYDVLAGLSVPPTIWNDVIKIINITTVQYDLNIKIKRIEKIFKTSPIGLGRKSFTTFRFQYRDKNYLMYFMYYILCILYCGQ